MEMQVYCVRDAKAEAYLTPFYMVNEAMAMRAISDCIQDENHQFNKHAEDFALYHLGVYSDSTGKFELNDAPVHKINLVDMKAFELVQEEE